MSPNTGDPQNEGPDNENTPFGQLPPDPFPGDPFSETSPYVAAGKPPEPEFGQVPGGLGALFQMLGAKGGGLNWDAARQTAIWTATNGEVEPLIDPLERIKLVELVRTASEAVLNATGLSFKATDQNVQVVTRAAWSAFALEDFRPWLEALAVSAGGSPAGIGGFGDQSGEELAISQMFTAMGPMLVSTQAGTAVGNLAQHSLCTYDWPLLRTSNRLTLVPRAIAAFASEWALPLETVMTHVCVGDVAMAAVLSQPHIARRIDAAIRRFVSNARIDFNQMFEDVARNMEGTDPATLIGSPTGMQQMFGSFDVSGFVQSGPGAAGVHDELDQIMRPILGYVDYITAIVGARMVGDNRQVVEAWRRRRVADGAARPLGQLLGFNVNTGTYERGAVFVGGVLQRAGGDALNGLWAKEANFPTPAELDAPGLWLARVGLDG